MRNLHENGNNNLGNENDITGNNLVLAVLDNGAVHVEGLILHVAVISDDGEDPAQHCSHFSQHVCHTCGVVPAPWRACLETFRRPVFGLVAVVFGMSRQLVYYLILPYI